MSSEAVHRFTLYGSFFCVRALTSGYVAVVSVIVSIALAHRGRLNLRRVGSPQAAEQAARLDLFDDARVDELSRGGVLRLGDIFDGHLEVLLNPLRTWETRLAELVLVVVVG